MRKIYEENYIPKPANDEPVEKKVKDLLKVGCKCIEIAKSLEISTAEVREIRDGKKWEKLTAV